MCTKFITLFTLLFGVTCNLTKFRGAPLAVYKRTKFLILNCWFSFVFFFLLNNLNGVSWNFDLFYFSYKLTTLFFNYYLWFKGCHYCIVSCIPTYYTSFRPVFIFNHHSRTMLTETFLCIFCICTVSIIILLCNHDLGSLHCLVGYKAHLTNLW